jgi:hypothetical protein
MKSFTPLVSLVAGALSLMAACAVCAAPLLDMSSSLTGSDPIQNGRLSRSGKASIWTRQTPFPGVFAAGTAFVYHAFTIPAAKIGVATFLQVTIDNSKPTLFLSAYDTAYLPGSSLSANYLGDNGSSGNSYSNATFFQVTLPAGHDLVLVVNDVGGGVGAPFRITVEGFVDSHYDDPHGPLITSIKLSGSNLIFNGINPLAAGTFSVLTSADLVQPLSAWNPVWTNLIGGGTNFTFTATNVVNQDDAKRFYGLELQ